jgi:hypothetical protein
MVCGLVNSLHVADYCVVLRICNDMLLIRADQFSVELNLFTLILLVNSKELAITVLVGQEDYSH